MLFKRNPIVVFSRLYQLLLVVAVAIGTILLTQCENEEKVLEPLEDNWESAIKYQHIPDGLNSLSAESCGACHQDHYKEWQRSTHSQAWTDLQFQSEVKKESSPYLCINCHIPLENQQEYFIDGLWNGDIYEPAKRKNAYFDKKLQQEGITCAACHVRDNMIIGPTGTEKAPHATKKDADHLSYNLCVSCHNANATVTPTLACTFETGDEWKAGPYFGKKDCISCHMQDTVRSIVPGYDPRPSHYHAFPGSGIPKSPHHNPDTLNGLDIKLSEIPLSYKKGDVLDIDLTAINAHAGHRVPSGDPERFMEFIFELKDSNGKLLASQRDTISEKWEWYPIAKKIMDNNLDPLDSRTYNFKKKLNYSGELRLYVTVKKHRLNEESARYNKLGKDYPLFITIYEKEFRIGG